MFDKIFTIQEIMTKTTGTNLGRTFECTTRDRRYMYKLWKLRNLMHLQSILLAVATE